ncbi:hypothetical protein GCM10029963_53650 [Micromonospora andamanensis]
MADAGLVVEVAGAVATVVIRNPGRRNAMTPAMWRQLPVLLDGLEVDPAVRVVVLTGADGTFCAGADLGDLDELLAAGDGSIAVVAEERLATFAKPTVAVVRGACVGGGCQLAVACDLRIAAADARFGVPRPGWGWSTRRPPRTGCPGWSARRRPSTCSSPASWWTRTGRCGSAWSTRCCPVPTWPPGSRGSPA